MNNFLHVLLLLLLLSVLLLWLSILLLWLNILLLWLSILLLWLHVLLLLLSVLLLLLSMLLLWLSMLLLWLSMVFHCEPLAFERGPNLFFRQTLCFQCFSVEFITWLVQEVCSLRHWPLRACIILHFHSIRSIAIPMLDGDIPPSRICSLSAVHTPIFQN